MEIQEMFEFELDFQNLKISSSDDTLNEFIEKVNSKTYKNTTELLSQATKVYGDIFVEEEKPLYEGQDVFELDNDNNDIKFLERVRIKEEDFNSDLFLVVFEFLEPKNISILSRVSKKFYKLTNDQLLWKGICERNQIEITEEHKDNLKQNYIESLYSYFLDFESTTKTAIKPTTLYDFKQSAGHNIVIGTKITKGRHKWSVHYLKYVPKHDGNCYSVVGISNNTEATQIGCSLNTYGIIGKGGKFRIGVAVEEDFDVQTIPFGSGDVVSVDLDFDKKTMGFYVNGLYCGQKKIKQDLSETYFAVSSYEEATIKITSGIYQPKK